MTVSPINGGGSEGRRRIEPTCNIGGEGIRSDASVAAIDYMMQENNTREAG